MNRVIVVFANNGTMATTQTPLWQYDYGQILVIQGLQLPQAYEVHFCNSTDTTTITSIGNADGVEIPDQFLRSGERIYAYVYLHTGEDDGETEYKITIPVMDRAEPTDIEPTPAQESTIGQLISALNDAVDTAEEAASKGPVIQDDYWYVWDSTAGEYVNTNVKAAGIDGEDGTDGNNAWTIDAENTRVVGSYIQCPKTYLVGPSGATAKAGDVVFISDGRMTQISRIVGQRADTTLIGDLHGADGAPGQDGYSPEVTITEITGGHRVTITDEDHPEGQSFDVMDGQGGSGSSDYNDLSNKPSIEGVTLSGNKTAAQLGLAKASDIPTVPVTSVNGKTGAVVLNASDVGAGTYSKPSGGIPKTDLASDVQTSLGKAGTALQPGDVAEPFVVTYSTSDMTTWTCDKTFAQITAAIAAGKQVVMLLSVAGTPFGQVSSFFNFPTGIQAWVRFGPNTRYQILHLDDNTVSVDQFTEDAQWIGAVASNQGVSHAGEFLVVGNDGIVTTMSLSTWQGGNY